MNYWLGYLGILLVGSGTLVALMVYLHRRTPPRPIFENLLLLVLTLFWTLMGLEFFFKVFFAQPDSAPTLARRNWEERYYQGTYNSLGYRDAEWTDALVADKIKVMVVGDSFVEGAGIEYPSDRFSNQLAQKLGANYVVFNLGKGGANTKDEIEALISYPYKPDILIFSYVINDIEGSAAWQRGLERPPSTEIPAWLSPIVRNSYVLNFIYWRLVRLFSAQDAKDKWQWFFSLYEHSEVWWLHQQELLSIYEGAKSEHIPLLVVVFPTVDRLEESKAGTERVSNLFRGKGVPTIDVGDLIKDMPTSELMASPVDSHPSELVHSLVAEALYQEFAKAGLTGLTKSSN